MENQVKILRKAANKTMKELSEETGIGLSSISNYENGYSNPKRENANILAEYFGVSVAYLLGYSNDLKTGNIVKSVAQKQSSELQEIMISFTKLSDSSQKLVLELIRKLQDLEQSSSE